MVPAMLFWRWSLEETADPVDVARRWLPLGGGGDAKGGAGEYPSEMECDLDRRRTELPLVSPGVAPAGD